MKFILILIGTIEVLFNISLFLSWITGDTDPVNGVPDKFSVRGKTLREGIKFITAEYCEIVDYAFKRGTILLKIIVLIQFVITWLSNILLLILYTFIKKIVITLAHILLSIILFLFKKHQKS